MPAILQLSSHTTGIVLYKKQFYIHTHKHKLANLILTLPHSNTEAERIFSLVIDMKNKRKNKLSSKTLNSICVVKSNFLANNTACEKF